MKTLKIFALSALCLGLATPAQAIFVGPSSAESCTVAQAKEMRDESPVMLIGFIENHLGGEDYMFKDATGSIKVEIDQDVWQGINVTPSDKVEIKGEVDTHMYKPTDIEVESIRIVR